MNRRRNVRPLLLERLEDRTLLSTYTVNGLGDAGSGSGLAGDLRYCVNRANANPGSTIQFGVTGAINLGSGLTISSNLTITGPGASSVAVKGGGSSSNFSVFTVNSGVTASISGLTISNGNAPNGGGVYNAGSLTLTDDTLSGNSAQYGGGVYNGHGTATLTNDTLSGNSAQSDGGGVYNGHGTATLTNDTLPGNLARYGGGVYNSGTATLTNDTLSGNSAQSDGGGVYNGHGTATLTNDTLSGNSAQSDGGGVYNGHGTATLTNDTLSGNSAQSEGGGVCNYGTATLTNDTLSGNSAIYGGGVCTFDGTATLTNDTLSGNSAQSEGGGVCNYGTATLTNDTLSGNSAQCGGGVTNSGTATLTNDTLSGNSAQSGGGVCTFHGTATLTNDTLSGNSAQCGGGVTNSGTATLTNDTLSGNSAIYGGGVYNYSYSSTATLTNDTLSGNSAQSGGGVCTFHGTATLNNTVVANSPSGGDIYGSVSGSNNLIDASTAGGLTNGVNGNIVGVNPLLASLGNYGGPTQTMPPLPGSRVIGAGSTVLIPAGITTDQRGEPRIVNGKVDIGAVQSQGSTFNPAPAPQPYKLVKEDELVPVTKLVKVTELVPVVKQVKVTELVKVKNKLVKQIKLVDETKLVKETKPIKETKLYLSRRRMRRFHESRIVLQLSGRKQAVILIVTSRKEEHHGLVSRAVDRGRATRRQRGTVLSSQPPNSRKDARALVVAHRAHASACGQGCRSQSGHRPAIRGRVSAGGLGRLAAVESQSPGERDGRLSRVDPRLLREATSHDHRRGVRTHLSTDRVAPRAQPGAQVPQGSGPEVLPGPCDPRAAKKKLGRARCRPSRFSRNRTEATLGRRPSR